jgi:hypothetical protein
MALLKPKTESKLNPVALPTLLKHLFEPAKAERFVVATDQPESPALDNEEWRQQRTQAASWLMHLQQLGARVSPLLTFPPLAAGASDRPPAQVLSACAETDCLVVFCQDHRPSAWRHLLAANPRLRIALMPGTSKLMEESSWGPDTPDASARAERTRHLLGQAIGARIEFSTGQVAYFDLRFQKAGSRLANCRAHDSVRLVSLPGGEAWTTTYDGEGSDSWCDTIGIIPFYQNGLLHQFFVERGRIKDIIGDGPQVARYRKWFEDHPASCRIQRLGFGCNFRAGTMRNRIEARTAGFYWSIDPEDEPSQLADNEPYSGLPPLDYLYGPGQAVVASEVTLMLNDGREVPIVENGRVT